MTQKKCGPLLPSVSMRCKTNLCATAATSVSQILVEAYVFAMLSLPVDRVFITENETNFLAFPPVPNTLVVFGAGYGWDALVPATWLRQCALHYWGDIDTHGFAILNQLRGSFPHTASFLMDHDTLLAHRLHWGEEPDPVRHALPHLTAQESLVYDELRLDRLQTKLRLEQERVGFGWLRERLAQVGGSLVR